VSSDAQEVMSEVTMIYAVNKVADPTYHLGCDYIKPTDKGVDYLNIGGKHTAGKQSTHSNSLLGITLVRVMRSLTLYPK
jgi:hypothetical protein